MRGVKQAVRVEIPPQAFSQQNNYHFIICGSLIKFAAWVGELTPGVDGFQMYLRKVGGLELEESVV